MKWCKMEAVKIRKSRKGNSKNNEEETEKYENEGETSEANDSKSSNEDDDSQNSDHSSSFEIISRGNLELQAGNCQQIGHVEGIGITENSDECEEKLLGGSPTEDSACASLVPDIIDDACKDFNVSDKDEHCPKMVHNGIFDDVSKEREDTEVRTPDEHFDPVSKEEGETESGTADEHFDHGSKDGRETEVGTPDEHFDHVSKYGGETEVRTPDEHFDHVSKEEGGTEVGTADEHFDHVSKDGGETEVRTPEEHFDHVSKEEGGTEVGTADELCEVTDTITAVNNDDSGNQNEPSVVERSNSCNESQDHQLYLSEDTSQQHSFQDSQNMYPDLDATLEEENLLPSAPCFEELAICEDGGKDAVVEDGEADEDTEQTRQVSVKPFSAEQILALYENPILDAKEVLIQDFISAESALRNDHELFGLLRNFLRARNSLRGVQKELEGAKYDANECIKMLWLKDHKSCSDEGVCEDGKTVKAVHKYEVAEFSDAAASNLKRQLKGIREILYEKHSLHAHNAQVSKLQIENYLSHMVLNCSALSKLNHDANVTLKSDGEQADMIKDVKKIKECLSILFYYQRQPVRDDEFKFSCRQWIVELGGTLMRVASCADHVYLLSHILRCPPGVGEWATSLLQVPFGRAWDMVRCFNSRGLHNSILILSILCSPIQAREEFMSAFKASALTQNSEESNSWLVVDVEGEEEDEIQNTWTHLQENDLVCLLNQVPFEDIFRTILGIQVRDDVDKYDVQQYTENDMLTLISFATNLVLVLRQGLKTYHSLRFRQLTKRISRLIVHAVEYVTDHMENFLSFSLCEDEWKSRIQVEYDHFFFRSVRAISSSHKLGAWQYLAMLPYTQLSSQLLWKLWYLLHCHYQEEITEALKDKSYFLISESAWRASVLEDEDCRLQFEEKLSVTSEAETMYLLTTFINMAAARQSSSNEGGFVSAVTIDTLEVGYIRLSTRDSCYKVARDLLARLSSVHPTVLTDIVTFLAPRISHVGKLCLYLARELPWDLWQPSTRDLALLGEWIYSFPPHAIESQLARLILLGLNWGYSRKGLWLPHEQHRKVCLMVVDAVCKHAPEKSGLNLSSLTLGLRNPSPSENMYMWAWNILFRLQLHETDLRGMVPSGTSLVEPNPDLLKRWQNTKQSAIGFALLSLSNVGFSLPELCRTGLTMVYQLCQQYQYKATLVLLSTIVPLFIPCPNDLLNNNKFTATVQSLLSADSTYLKMAKNLISNEFPGRYLQLFADMIDSQLLLHDQSWNEVLFLWIRSLTSLEQWNKNASILYLVDRLLRAAFVRQDSWRLAKMFFEEKLKNSMEQRSGACSGLSSLFNWMSGSGIPGSILPRYTCPEAPWLALLALDLEEELEDHTGLWKGLQRNLLCDASMSVDDAFKSAYASSSFSGTVPSSNSVIIYRWAHQALDNPMDHPTTPLIWQRFFGRYLSRVPQKEGEAELGCISQRFVQGQGLLNSSLETKIKKRLQETAESYQGTRLENLFQTFCLWINEPKLHEATLYLPVLSPQFNTDLLLRLFQEDKRLWVEYMDMTALLEEMESSKKCWSKERFGSSVSQTGDRRCSTPKTPTQRLLNRLHSYDPPLPAPPLHLWTVPLPSVPRRCLMDPQLLKSTAEPHLVLLNDFTKTFGLQLAEHSALDCRYLEQTPELYKNRQVELTVSTPCDLAKVKPGQDCTGEAQIVLQFEECCLNEVVSERMKDNRTEWEKLVNRVSKPPDTRVCQAAAQLHNIILKMLEVLKHAQSDRAELERSGQTLFYLLVEAVGEDTDLYPPARQLLASLIEDLGQVVIAGRPDQCCSLVKSLSCRPQLSGLSGLLAPHFDPSQCDTDIFLQLYQQITSLPTQQQDLIFVLLSKFDLPGWLTSKRPKHSEQSRLMAYAFQAIRTCGFHPDQSLLSFELYRRHVCILLSTDFPEHYGEVLKFLLEASSDHAVAPCIWFDFMYQISDHAVGKSDTYPGPDVLRKYGQKQKALKFQEIRQTIEYLAKHFQEERMKNGLYGLYPKYREYSQCISTFLSMMSHAFVLITLQVDDGTLARNLIDRLWSPLFELYRPWIAPVRVGKNTAGWVQDLAGSGSMLQPWIPGDCGPATLFMDAYVHTLSLLHDVIPAPRSILSRTWELYFSVYAQQGVKDHVLSVVHAAIIKLPWSMLTPDLHDLDLMVKLVDSYLPECHGFLGRVFMLVPWNDVAASVIPGPAHAKLHCALLALIVKLAREPVVRESKFLSTLLSQWHYFTWHVVDPGNYDNVVNWFVMSCDPRIVLSNETKDENDHALFGFLQLAGGLTAPGHSKNCREKWGTLVRAWVRLLMHCANKHKQLLHSFPQRFSESLLTLLATIQGTVGSAPESSRDALADQLIGEVVHLLNSPSEDLRDAAVVALTKWLGVLGGVTLLHPTLNLLSKRVNTLSKAPLLETALAVALSPPASLSWKELLQRFPVSSELVPTCVKNSHFILLYSYLIQQSDSERALTMLQQLLLWIKELDLTEENEAKVALVWLGALAMESLANDADIVDETAVQSAVNELKEQLSTLGQSRGPGLLSVIGLGSSSTIPPKCRLLCTGLAAVLESKSGNTESASVLLSRLEAPQQPDTVTWIRSWVEDSSKDASQFVVHLASRLYNQPWLYPLR